MLSGETANGPYFEQAVAVMAAGDVIDAELRLQEFLLAYPEYPGAHVNLAIIFAGRGDDAAAEINQHVSCPRP